MSANWTIQNTSVVGETQWMNANYIDINVANNATGGTDFIEIAGYTAGSISFTTDQPPSGWAGGSSLDVSIQGAIGGTFAAPDSVFFAQTLAIPASASTLTTFVIEWNVPLQFVKLFINNDTGPRNITNIRLICESQGGGIGYTSSSGATIGPGGVAPEVQFNNGGVFGGASGVLYDATANTNTGQVKLADGSASEPMLAFSDGSHPAGNYDTGIYRQGVNQLGVSAGGTLELGVSGNHVSAQAGTNGNPGFNFGITGSDTNTGIYRVQADTLGIATGGTQQVTVTSSSGPFPANMIRGLNVGTTGNVTGIQRLSSTAANSWEDGNCGNSNFIVFTACDFAGAFTNPTGPGGRAQTFVTWSGATATRSPVVYNGINPGPALACKLIPKGFVINSRDEGNCFIYSDIVTGLTVPQQMFVDVRVQEAAGPNIESAVQIASATINAGAGSWQTAGDGSVNRTVINISGPLPPAATGTGFNTINIYVEPQLVMDGTNGGIVAFKVPIRRI